MQEDQNRLFQEIIQIQPNKHQGGQGSGLGLYSEWIPIFLSSLTCPSVVSAEIVRLHNGHYSVTSPGEGLGSTFSVFLPVYSSSAEINESLRQPPDFRDLEEGCRKEDLPEESSSEKSKRSKDQESPSQYHSLSLRDFRRGSTIVPLVNEDQQFPPANPNLTTVLTSAHSRNHDSAWVNWRVLVVDDAASNRKIMSRYLKIRGMRVDEADCGKTAVNMCLNSLSQNYTHDLNFTVDDSSAYDVIFLDYDMPNMTGPETALNLRSIGYRGHLIGLTGHTDGGHHENFIASGVSQVLVKPVSVHLLDELFEGQSPHQHDDMTLTSSPSLRP